MTNLPQLLCQLLRERYPNYHAKNFSNFFQTSHVLCLYEHPEETGIAMQIPSETPQTLIIFRNKDKLYIDLHDPDALDKVFQIIDEWLAEK